MIFKSILDTWSDTWFANIYSYPMGCISNFLILFFETQEFWILKSNLSDFFPLFLVVSVP